MTAEKQQDRDRAEQMVRRWGSDPLQILSLDNSENQYFFGPEDCGVIFYTLAGRRTLSLGNPVCRPEDMDRLLSAYIDFCNQNHTRCIFNSLCLETAEILKSKGFAVAKYGEEGILTLAEYNLDGGKKGSLRRNVAKLNREGCFSEEYHAEEHRDQELEKEIYALQQDWQGEKNLNLTYSVGDLQFDRPCGRRYFITRDGSGTLLTALSFLPYQQNSGWCVDVMYRRPDGPTGEMEHAIISAAWQLRDEGAAEVSLNIAPLAGIDPQAPETSREERIMHALFCHMDYGYSFKGLHRFKDKFGPSVWRPRYLVYDHRISMVRLARSIADVKGAADWDLRMKYLRFFLSYILLPGKYQDK